MIPAELRRRCSTTLDQPVSSDRREGCRSTAIDRGVKCVPMEGHKRSQGGHGSARPGRPARRIDRRVRRLVRQAPTGATDADPLRVTRATGSPNTSRRFSVSDGRADAGRERYGERLAELSATPLIGSVGDSFDNALAETVNGYY